MQTPVQDSQLIRQKMKTLAQRNPAYQELCQLVGELLLETLQEADGWQEPAPQPSCDSSGLAQGRSLWDREALELDWPRLWDLAERLARSLSSRPGGDQTLLAIGNLRAAAGEKGGGQGAGAFRAVLTADRQALDRLAQKHGGELQVLALVLRMALRPALLAAARRARQEVDLAAWSFGHCPVCGSAPGLAHLEGEGGKRTLHCSLCETPWPYPRLQCPFCESQEPGIISRLKAQEEEGLQVEVCSRCGQYIKTLDLREIAGPVILPLDDAATWHLDLVVQEQGCKGT